MTTIPGTIRLAVRLMLGAKLKAVLLAVLVAVSLLVFLVVTELSRVSSDGLDEAIGSDLGRSGTHRLSFGGDNLGLTPREVATHVEIAFADVALEPPVVVEVLPAITPDCPPLEQLGPQRVLIPRHTDGEPVAVPYGAGLPPDTTLCFDGQVIPDQAIYVPTPGQGSEWGSGMVVDPAYATLVRVSTTEPVTYEIAVHTGRRTAEGLAELLEMELRDLALLQGEELSITSYTPQAGQSIRSASEGIVLVYAIIGWGVLALGGLGLLVAQLIVVRDRSWFVGLCRAVGARTGHIAGLVIADVVLILAAGTALALAGAALLQPVANDFAREAFQVDVHLLNRAAMPRLVAGGLLVLVVGAAYPAIRATRQDPLEVLEGA